MKEEQATRSELEIANEIAELGKQWAEKIQFIGKLWYDAAKRAEAAEQSRERLREALEKVLASAYPNPREHPTMCEAWESARAALKGDLK